MEDMMGAEWEQKSTLINELTQGRELARQLQAYLNVPSSNETCELLVQQIQASYEKALSMLNYHITSFTAGPKPQQPSPLPIRFRTPESPPFSRTESPRNEDHDRDFKEQDQLNLDASTIRKSQPRPSTVLEGPLDDGFSWRKYGQKDILGAKYPRWYYRCTHRNVRGCLATKQVQKSDNDPTIFEITYRGSHACNYNLQPSNLMLPLGPSENQEQGIEPHQHNQGLKGSDTGDQTYPSFPNYLKPENKVVFLSPSMSSPNPTPSVMMNNNTTVEQPQLTESENILAPTVGLNLPFGNAGFDPNFTFDNYGFIS